MNLSPSTSRLDGFSGFKSRFKFFALLSIMACAIPCLSSADTTGLILDNVPYGLSTGGGNRYFTTSDGSFSAYYNAMQGSVGISFHNGHDDFGVGFRPPNNEVLKTGVIYDDAVWADLPFNGPGIEISGNGWVADLCHGEFIIKELVITNQTVTSFHAVFVQRDTYGLGFHPTYTAGPKLTGEIFFHASDAMPPPHHLTTDRVVTGSQGQPFRFQIQTNAVEASYNAWSLPAGLTINMTTGLISGTPDVHGEFVVGITTSGASGNLSSSITLKLEPAGHTSGHYSAVSIKSAFGDAVGSGPEFHDSSEGDFIAVSYDQHGSDTYNFHNAVFVTFQSDSGRLISMHFAAPGGQDLAPRIYDGAVGYKTNSSNAPRMEVLTDNAEPASIRGSFRIKEISFYPEGRIKSLHVTFTQYANGSSAPLTGTLCHRTDNVITSPLLEYAREGRAFSYQIATNSTASRFAASPLPAGLHVDPSSGRISGTPTHVGTFTFPIAATNGSSTRSDLLTLIVRPTEMLANISTRGIVAPDDGAMIAGFIVTGPEPKKVLIRALGPSLSAVGVHGVITDPRLRLVDVRGATLATNENWQFDHLMPNPQRPEIEATHIAPKDPRESAIIATLAPGAYTAIETNIYSSVGIGLIELYDLSAPSDSVLANLSTRGIVRFGDDVMIGGVILIGTQHSGGRLLVRAIGPSLGRVGFISPLADPTLQLYDANGASLAFNDNWKQTQATQISATGFAPSSALESAILITRPPGRMTAIVRGKNSAIGIALVEVYDIP